MVVKTLSATASGRRKNYLLKTSSILTLQKFYKLDALADAEPRAFMHNKNYTQNTI